MTSGQQPFDSDAGGGADLRAAEYVLGLLDAAAHRDAQARIERDPVFAAEVSQWEGYFAPWLEQIAPVAVPETLWPRIRTTLWSHELPQRGDPQAPSTPPSLWRSLPFWRGLAAGGFAVAAASLVALFVGVQQLPSPQPPAPPPVVTTTPPPAAAEPMVVSLRHEDGTMAYTATVDRDTGVITLIPAFMPEDARVPELWLIPADGVPRSLGVVARDHAERVVIPQDIRPEAVPDTVFAVSLEPEGGSPTGQPTGPVVATGSLIQL